MTTAIICIFIVGYIMIAMENVTKVNKSAVALLMAVLCWTLLYLGAEAHPENISAFTKALGETSEIIFFLMGAMVIVEVVDTNGGFDFVREKLVSRSKVSLLWKMALMTFFLSAVLDNMTTAIVMVMVLNKLISNKGDKMFYSAIIILAANSGGAFSPIGDVTTIMLWVKGNVSTFAIVNLWKNLDNLFFKEAKYCGRLVRSPSCPPRRELSKCPLQGLCIQPCPRLPVTSRHRACACTRDRVTVWVPCVKSTNISQTNRI